MSASSSSARGIRGYRLAPAGDRRAGGFTLIEILVVVVIIAILFTITTLSMDATDRDDPAREDIERVSALIDLAGDRAIIEGGEYGLHISRDGYRFMQYFGEEGGWITPDDRAFRHRDWPEDVEVELEADGGRVELDSELDEDDEPTPQILLTATGESTPFTLVLRHRDDIDGTVLEARMDGRREIRGEDEMSGLD